MLGSAHSAVPNSRSGFSLLEERSIRNFPSAATRVGILSATFLAGYALAESRAPKEPKGIKIENLGAMDLAGEIDSVDGLKLHRDRLTVQPGGMSPFTAGPRSSTWFRAATFPMRRESRTRCCARETLSAAARPQPLD